MSAGRQAIYLFFYRIYNIFYRIYVVLSLEFAIYRYSTFYGVSDVGTPLRRN